MLGGNWFFEITPVDGCERPTWEYITQLIRAGEVDTLICERVDRLSRSPAELSEIMELLALHNVTLISLREKEESE
jgi:DNA invertase Pin-like site-specific DNA recombinase